MRFVENVENVSYDWTFPLAKAFALTCEES